MAPSHTAISPVCGYTMLLGWGLVNTHTEQQARVKSNSSAREGRAVRFQEILRAFFIFSLIIITIINIIIMLVDSSAPMHARATYAIVCGMGLVAAAGSLC